jgi:hypothetical protein
MEPKNAPIIHLNNERKSMDKKKNQSLVPYEAPAMKMFALRLEQGILAVPSSEPVVDPYVKDPSTDNGQGYTGSNDGTYQGF